MLIMDGSEGEGGGQILRSSLALSIITGTPVRFVHVRAKRSKPGLLRQHLTAVEAAAKISHAKTEGVQLRSDTFEFSPGSVHPGDYTFSVGTAGSATLVLQTILPPLMLASGTSRLILEGGTHNPFAPPFEFLTKAFLPLIARMGPRVTAELERPGFYPAGGGRFKVSVHPGEGRFLSPHSVCERGPLQSRKAQALVAHLPNHIGQRQLDQIAMGLKLEKEHLEIRACPESKGPGNAVLIEIESENVTEIFVGFGERGVKAEKIAQRTVQAAEVYLASEAAVGPHLADQLLLPMALAGEGSFTATELTQHSKTNMDVIQRFLNVSFSIQDEAEKGHRVEISKK